MYDFFFLNSPQTWLQQTTQRRKHSPFFFLWLCSNLTSHISVGMKIRFKNSSVPDNSDKVWNAKLYMAVINICKVFFFFHLKPSGCLSWSKEIVFLWHQLSCLYCPYSLNASSLRASYTLGTWSSKDWQCSGVSWFPELIFVHQPVSPLESY